MRAKILRWDVPWSVLEIASQPVQLEMGTQIKGGRKGVWQGWEETVHTGRLWIISV